MWPRPVLPRHGFSRVQSPHRLQKNSRRCLMTLAIETSCDDTSVAILEKTAEHGRHVAQLHFHRKVTSDNAAFLGVHPLVSLRSHQENLANLVHEAIAHLPPKEASHVVIGQGVLQGKAHESSEHVIMRRLPDFISVTRGPGMRSNLFTGLDTAKGLAVAWQKPLVGVHHMQAHALTPRLVSALGLPPTTSLEPNFPFLSILASGGHTLLVHSLSATEHRLLGSTNDIAVGECLDKLARILLPPELLQTTKSTMYGALLDQFAFAQRVPDNVAGRSPRQVSSSGAPRNKSVTDATGCSAREYLETSGDYDWYEVPSNHEDALKKSATKWGWSLNQPLITGRAGPKIENSELSFSGLLTAAERVVRYQTDPATRKRTKIERNIDDISLEEKRDVARETMRAAFEHVAYRVILAFQSMNHDSAPRSVVLAGGVAANAFLRHILASTLCAHGDPDVKLYFPPPSYCTDNAAMIAWTGLEMFEAGHTDPLSIRAIRKWPLEQLLDPIIDG